MNLSLLILLAQISFARADARATATTAESKELPAYVEECRDPALAKMRDIAQANGFRFDETTVSIAGIDDRWYNPSKYVWFKAPATTRDGATEVLQVLTQKSVLPNTPCF